jgi:hypothetical protein
MARGNVNRKRLIEGKRGKNRKPPKQKTPRRDWALALITEWLESKK